MVTLFSISETSPIKVILRFAIKSKNEFNIRNNKTDIFANINTDDAIDYAGELSADDLELFYSQVTLSNLLVFKLNYANREQKKMDIWEHYIKCKIFSRKPKYT